MSAEGQDVAGETRNDTEVPGLDPWGLRRVERLLLTVEGVDSLKIVPDGAGGIDEIHVLSSSGLGAKQVVRNIESALLAQFGLQIDHRKISVAQVRERDIPRVEEAPEPAPRERRLQLESLQIDRFAGEIVKTHVLLSSGDETYAGEAEGPDYPRARLEVTAESVLHALEQATDPQVSFAIEGIGETSLFGRPLMVAVVQGFVGRRMTVLPGISRIDDSPEEAAVLACLDATNRWLARHTLP